MKRTFWLFRKLNLSLRTEIIINISILMLVAILLIGFTISKMNEKNILQEKINYCENMARNIQGMVDFLTRERNEIGLDHPKVRRDLQEITVFYTKGKGLNDLMFVDTEMRILAHPRTDLIGQPHASPPLKSAIQSGLFSTEIEKTGGLLSTEYQKVKAYAPLWIRGKLAGAIRMELLLGEMMVQVLGFQRIILLSMIVDSVILIAFGSLLLSRVLVKPLKDLVTLTQKIEEGDFDERMEVTSVNEIGQLIASFNRMEERLKENQENIENQVRSLESANRQLKQTQEELIRTEKLASIGRFAAGIAHEVGNPLGAILGYTSMLEKGLINPDESKDYLKRIEKEIERISHIIRELLNFSRPSRGEIRDVNVNVVLENTVSFLSYQKDFRNIETKLQLQSDLPPLKGDESQLSQVFMNIILNAIDAMPSGGTLGIHTDVYVIEEAFVNPFQSVLPARRKGDPEQADYTHLRKPNPLSSGLTKFSMGERLVRVQVFDTGIGIERSDLERIFDPFFTTKPPDKGTGLGLSICLRIVESMRGAMRVESEVGKGSVFELYFPVV